MTKQPQADPQKPARPPAAIVAQLLKRTHLVLMEIVEKCTDVTEGQNLFLAEKSEILFFSPYIWYGKAIFSLLKKALPRNFIWPK